MDNYNNYYQGGEQNPYNPPVQEQKSSNKIWLWILIPVLIIIIGVVVFYFFNSSATKISDNEFSQGTNLQIKQDNEAKFIIDDEEHTIKVNSVSGDSVNLIIQSDPIQVDIKIGETKKFDLNNDGFYDIQVKLNGIEDGVPEIYIKKIHESTCSENWNCSEWSSCSEQGIQTRSCTDLNDCGTTKNKPATTQSCTYTCVEDWSCTNWSSCTSGQQTRTCTDSNSCETTKDKPTEQQSCTLQYIDCGVAYLDEVSNVTKTLDNGVKLTFENFDEDEALVCFGENLLGDCVEGEVKIINEYGTTEKIKTKGVVNGDCIIRVEFGDVSEDDIENKRFENTFLECPIPMSEIPSLGCHFGACLEEGMPGQITIGVLVSMVLDVILFNSESECSGTMIERLTKGFECLSYLDCQDYNETTIGFCDESTKCQYIPFEGECRVDSDCPAICENCINETFAQCNLMFVAQSFDPENPNYVGRSSCISCFNHDDCKEGFICNKEGKCVEGLECDDDNDCKSDEYCAFYPKVCTKKSSLGEECEGYGDSCINGMCIDGICVEENFYDQFESCRIGDCTETCNNCKDGVYSCAYIVSAGKNICIECSMDFDCNDGYKCHLYECILD